MKKLFYFLCLLVMGLNFTSCDDDDDVDYVDVTLHFNIPEDTAGEDPTLSVNSLELKDINSGKIIRPIGVNNQNNGRSSVTDFSCTVTVPQGIYTINMEGIVSYVAEGEMRHANLRSFQESVELSYATASKPVEFPTFYYNPSDKGNFVIAEIFFTGSVTPEKKQYNGDAYFRIVNNSDSTLCADGLTIAESSFQTVKDLNYTPNIKNEAFTAQAIYRIPLGSNLMVKPGESILLVDNAINHKEANTNSFDLTKADFEWYDVSTNSFTDVDNPDVPNMEKIYCYTASVWSPHNRGFHSYVLARLGKDADHQLTAEEYLKGNYNYDYTYDWVYPGGVIPMSDNGYKILNEWIIDAVNLSVESEYACIVTLPSFDKGWTYCGKIDSDKTRYGKSVRRKVLSNKKLQDTNDSSFDFLPEQTADPYFKFY